MTLASLVINRRNHLLSFFNLSFIIDAGILGFSFSGEIREPFPSVIEELAKTALEVTSVDAPSSWDIESGPPTDGPGKSFKPSALVSLTAPKPLVNHFSGRHFIGGRYVLCFQVLSLHPVRVLTLSKFRESGDHEEI